MTYPGPKATTRPYGCCAECRNQARFTCGTCGKDLCEQHMPEEKRAVSGNAVVSGRFHMRAGRFVHPLPRNEEER